MPVKKQIPIVVALIKDDQGKLLIAKRNDPDLEGGHNKWELVGGKIEFGENPEDAIIREVKEESGLEVKTLRVMPKIISRIWEKAGDQHQVFLIPYECKIIGGKLHTEKFDEKIAELRFISKAEIDDYEFIGLREKEMLQMSFEQN